MKTILFVCVGNAGRSQMAEAFAKLHGTGKIEAQSAGTVPAEHVNPLVVQVMTEKGLDLANNRPKRLRHEMARAADLIITMGCSVEEVCPAPLLKGKTLIDWGLDDPKGQPIEKVKEIRDEIERRVEELLSTLSREQGREGAGEPVN